MHKLVSCTFLVSKLRYYYLNQIVNLTRGGGIQNPKIVNYMHKLVSCTFLVRKLNFTISHQIVQIEKQTN